MVAEVSSMDAWLVLQQRSIDGVPVIDLISYDQSNQPGGSVG